VTPGQQPTEVARADVGVLVARARALASAGRRLLGITGAPGAGKSTLAEELVSALGASAVLVPMDGFHLADAELTRLGRHERKGAIDTFDAAGYASLLGRLRGQREPAVYAPLFRRDLEDAIAGSILVADSVPLVVTEGNYLLADTGPWTAVRELLDEVWYVEPVDSDRLDRLTRRHIAFGRDPAEAYSRARGVDQVNADVIAATRSRADLVVRG
jgi:pantothenate kinase